MLKGNGKPNLNQNYTVTMADMTYPALGAKIYWTEPGKLSPTCLIYLELDTSQKKSPALEKVKTRE